MGGGQACVLLSRTILFHLKYYNNDEKLNMSFLRIAQQHLPCVPSHQEDQEVHQILGPPVRW